MNKIQNFKLTLFFAWDWLKDYWWFPLLIVFSFLNAWVENFYSLSFLLTFFLGLVYIIIRVTIMIIIEMKTDRLNKKKLAEWNRQKTLLINNNRKLRYLNGGPVTIIDKATGVIKIIQSGKTDVVITTMN